MKNTFLIFGTLLLIFISCNTSQENQNQSNEIVNQENSNNSIVTGWDEYGLNGKVKRVTTRSISAENKNGSWATKPDANYYTLGEVNFDNDGKTTSTIIYGGGEVVLKDDFRYEDNRLVEVVQFNNSGEQRGKLKVNTSNPYVQREEIKAFDPNGNLISTIKLKWKNKRVVEMIHLVEDENTETYETYEFKDNREQSAILKRKAEGKEPEIYNYSNEYLDFDKNGNWIKRGEYLLGPNGEESYSIKERIIEYY